MQRTIELKRVRAPRLVRGFLEELSARLEEKLGHFQPQAVSLHVVFEENGSHKLYRTSVTCHVPGHVVAAHEERRDPGQSIREAFAELERRLDKLKAIVLHERERRRTRRARALAWVAAALLGLTAREARAEEAPGLTPKAAEALAFIQSEDPYRRQLGFLRLEALRDPATLSAIRPYADHRDPELRAAALRALAAIEGLGAVPRLLQALEQDRHPRVRRAALLGLEPLQAGDPAILAALLKALDDSKPDVRMTAADIVSRIEVPAAREAILIRVKRERDRNVRRVLDDAVKRLGGA